MIITSPVAQELIISLYTHNALHYPYDCADAAFDLSEVHFGSERHDDVYQANPLSAHL